MCWRVHAGVATFRELGVRDVALGVASTAIVMAPAAPTLLFQGESRPLSQVPPSASVELRTRDVATRSDGPVRVTGRGLVPARTVLPPAAVPSTLRRSFEVTSGVPAGCLLCRAVRIGTPAITDPVASLLA